MKVKNLVPQRYYSESRDFSYIGRLLEVIFNYAKTAVDLVDISLNNKNIPGNLIDLLTTTLGFESKHKYITSDLVSICNSFIWLLKHKGTLQAIDTAITILLHSQGITSNYLIEVDNKEYMIKTYLPIEMKDLILLEDIFEYILPTGYCYQFIYAIVDSGLTSTSRIATTDNVVIVTNIPESNLSYVSAINDENKDNLIKNMTISPTDTMSTTYLGSVDTVGKE